MTEGSFVMGHLCSPAGLEVLEPRRLLSAAVVMSPVGLTPQQVRHAYGFDTVQFTNGTKTLAADGRGQTIAIVTAYRTPRLAADLRVFNKTFGLPNRLPGGGGILSVATPQGTPSVDASWAQETEMDVEWAHAIAPGARLLLVEAKSQDPKDLFAAVDSARHRRNVNVISMSWGWDEPPAAVDYNAILSTPLDPGRRGNGITFVEAAADDGLANAFPDLSVNVVSVGGTTLTVDSSGTYAGETPLPQSVAPALVSYNAAPDPGFAMYDTTPFQGVSGWQTGNGTSVGAPQWAALLAIANEDRAAAHRPALEGRSQTQPALRTLADADFHLVTGATAATGRGSPFADRLIQDLVTIA